jgi:hypothetical protein
MQLQGIRKSEPLDLGPLLYCRGPLAVLDGTPADESASTVKALELRGLIRCDKGRDPPTIGLVVEEES